MDTANLLNASMDKSKKNQVSIRTIAYPLSSVFFPLMAMILCMLYLQTMLRFFGSSVLEIASLLKRMGTIFFVASLCTGSFFWISGRFISDARYQGNLQGLYATFKGTLLMCLIPGILGFGGYLWWMQESPVWMLLSVISFALIVCIGILLNYMCALYDMKEILGMILVGGLCMCLPMFVSPFVPAVYWTSYFFVCINFGFSILIGLLLGRFRVFFGVDSGSLRYFFSHLKKYVALIFIPILYLTGIYVAGIYEPTISQKAGLDFLMFLYVAAFAMLPGMCYAMLWMDRHYFSNLDRLMIRLYQRGTYEEIVIAGKGLWENLKFELKIFMLSQCIWIWIMAYLCLQWMAPEGKASMASLSVLFYAIGLSATVTVQVLNAYLLSLDRPGVALQVALVYCITSVVVMGILQYVGIEYFGLAMLTGACTSMTFGFLCVRRVYTGIERFLFQAACAEMPKA